MMKQALLGEFAYEAANTRKLLNAIPDSALEYRPQPHLWSIGQHGSHIAEVYNWFGATIDQDVFDVGGYRYDKGDISKHQILLLSWNRTSQSQKMYWKIATRKIS